MGATVKRSGQTLGDVLKRVQDSAITVGIHKTEGAHKGSDGATVVEVGTYNEYGTERIPERSFLRSTVNRNLPGYKGRMKDAYLGALRGTSMNLRAAMSFIGGDVADDIRKTIIEFTDPPNAPSTIKAKGRDDPLVDTGQMRDSIKWKYANDN